MRKTAIALAAFVALGAMLQGCGAVYAWDTMQLQSAKKQATQKLLADCNAGDRQACAYVSGNSYNR